MGEGDYKLQKKIVYNKLITYNLALQFFFLNAIKNMDFLILMNVEQ